MIVNTLQNYYTHNCNVLCGYFTGKLVGLYIFHLVTLPPNHAAAVERSNGLGVTQSPTIAPPP